MSDEEFAAFIQKAQAFYDNASSAQPATSTTTFATNSAPASDAGNSSSAYSSYSSSSSKNTWDEPAPAIVQPIPKEEPEEDKYSSYSFGNEMTDEEYIAYLNRSARASRKEEPKPAAAPETPATPAAESKPAKKSERKSFMPEEGEGGMTDEEFEAYLAEHGDDDDDEEGPVVYGAGKD